MLTIVESKLLYTIKIRSNIDILFVYSVTGCYFIWMYFETQSGLDTLICPKIKTTELTPTMS